MATVRTSRSTPALRIRERRRSETASRWIGSRRRLSGRARASIRSIFPPAPPAAPATAEAAFRCRRNTARRRFFAKLFIDGTPEEVAHEVARIQQGRSILDRVAGQARRLGRDVGAEDREKLDQYFTSVRDLEKRMVRNEDFARLPKPDPGIERIEDPAPGEDMVRFGLFLDLARLALETDLTRIATVYFVGTTKTPSATGQSFAYHNLSHHGKNKDKIEQLAILERDLIRQWGGLIQGLKETPEQDGRLLDRTIVTMGSGMGNASSHEATNLPVLIAGGRFQHGQHLAHDPKDPPPLCNLWVQVLQELGVETDRFGTSDKEALAGFHGLMRGEAPHRLASAFGLALLVWVFLGHAAGADFHIYAPSWATGQLTIVAVEEGDGDLSLSLLERVDLGFVNTSADRGASRKAPALHSRQSGRARGRLTRAGGRGQVG